MQQLSIVIACSILPLQESVAQALTKLGYVPGLSRVPSGSCKLKHRAPDPLTSLDALITCLRPSHPQFEHVPLLDVDAEVYLGDPDGKSLREFKLRVRSDDRTFADARASAGGPPRECRQGISRMTPGTADRNASRTPP
jgi:hypothetical protein